MLLCSRVRDSMHELLVNAKCKCCRSSLCVGWSSIYARSKRPQRTIVWNGSNIKVGHWAGEAIRILHSEGGWPSGLHEPSVCANRPNQGKTRSFSASQRLGPSVEKQPGRRLCSCAEISVAGERARPHEKEGV